MRAFLSILVCLSVACNNQTPNESKSKGDIKDDAIYPENAYICFDSSFSGKKGIRLYRLGDSIKQIQKLLNLIPVYANQDTFYRVKNPIIKKTKAGITTANIFAYFRNERLHRFRIIWEFSGKFVEESRSEFYSLVQKFTMGCLWEESLNIYEPADTLRLYYNNKAMTEYVSRFSDSSWQIQFECRSFLK